MMEIVWKENVLLKHKNKKLLINFESDKSYSKLSRKDK